MKSMIAIFLLAFTWLATGCAREQPEPAAESLEGDVAEAVEIQAPERNDRLFDNPYLEVMRVELQPGRALPPHEGEGRVVYALSDYTIRFQQDGQEMERSFSQGDVHYHQPGVHTVENVGSTAAEFVVFEHRDAALPNAPAAGEASDLDARVVYSLNDYSIELQQDEESETRSFRAGDVHFHEPGRHALTNAGSDPARFLVVEFKRR